MQLSTACLLQVSCVKLGQQAAFPLSQYLTLYFTPFSLNLSSSCLWKKKTSSSGVIRSNLGCLLLFFFLFFHSQLPHTPPLAKFSFFSGRLLNASSRKKKKKCHFYFINPIIFYSVAAKGDAGETQFEELQLKSMTKKSSNYLFVYLLKCMCTVIHFQH